VLGRIIRIGALGLVALTLVGSFAVAASASPGPFWYHRSSPSCGCAMKIAATEPEQIKGEGGEQRLKGKVVGESVEIRATSLQVKGIVYNNNLQGQAKLELTYHGLEVPKFPKCVVTIGINNTVKVFGHLAWKWNGLTSQLEQQKQRPEQHPDWIFTATELTQGATELPKTVFANFLFVNKGTESCVFNGDQFEVKGSVAGEIKPEQLETWGFAQTIKTPEGKQKQHFWNGEKNIGVETSLLLGTEPASLLGETTVQTAGRQGGAPQEVAIFEN
jgi:hypothetical protein